MKKDIKIFEATQGGEPKFSNYILIRFEDRKQIAVVRDSKTAATERFGKSPHYAGWHLIIDGVDFEFMHTIY